jgi:microcystin-dependent protein
MSYLIQLRNDTAANWASANPILSAGEAGFEVDTGIFKIGNGTSTWTALRETAGGPASVNPSGVISQFAGSTAPTGYLLCQGQSISTTTYSNLFAAIGYTYGGSGSSFIVPNLQNRIPVGKGPDTEFDTLGETGGAKTNTLTTANMAAHTHSGTTGTVSSGHTHNFETGGFSADHTHSGPSHNHSVTVVVDRFSVNRGTGTLVTQSASTPSATGSSFAGTGQTGTASSNHSHSGTTGDINQNHNHGFTTDNGTGLATAVNNLQPYIVVNYIIKT